MPEKEIAPMFVFDRSALAVFVPLALLAGAVFWSNRSSTDASGRQQSAQDDAPRHDQTVAASLPSR